MQALKIETESSMEMIDITAGVRRMVKEAGIAQGICHLFVPHTTAALTINETSDSSGRHELLQALLETVPGQHGHHGQSLVPHVLSSVVGPSEHVLVDDGRPVLGTWQAIYFCEFDGPRARSVLLRVSAD